MSNDVFTLKILAISGIMIMTGTINTLAFKYQSYYKYKHGITMTAQMFVGEFLNILILVIPILLDKRKREQHFLLIQHHADLRDKKVEISWFRIAFGGFLDAFGSSLQIVGLFLVSPSVYQLMKDGTIIFTAIFTIYYLKKPLYRHNWLGLMILLLGFIIVGLSSILYGKASDQQNTFLLNLFGVFLMFIGLIFTGFQYVYEEKILDDFELDPRRIIAAEGVLGTLTLSICLTITSYVPCYYKELCDVDIAFDNPAAAMLHLRNGYILFYTLVSVMSIMVFNLAGLYLTKFVSSVFRLIIDSIRIITVWVFAVLLGFEEIKIGSFLLQIVGFFFLILGILIFNEIIVVSFMGFDKKIGIRRLSANFITKPSM